MIWTLAIIYIAVAIYLFAFWMECFEDFEKLSSQEKLTSYLTLTIAGLFWPIVIPFAYTKIIKKQMYDDIY